MAAYTSSGYAVADIAALKAIASSDRPASGSGIYALAYVSDVQWFEFDPDAVSGGITPDSGTGRWFPLGREVLRANRTYYVRTDGSDSNNGLANTSGGAFLTIQKAVDVVASLDISIFDVTIQIGDGTYSSQAIELKSPVGAGKVIIQGNTSNFNSVVLTGTSANPVFRGAYNGTYRLQYLNLGNTNNDIIFLNGTGATILEYGNINFAGGTGSFHIAIARGRVYPVASYTISGGGAGHLYFGSHAYARFRDFGLITVTLTGTPSFATAFCFMAAYSFFEGGTDKYAFSGSATGKRYDIRQAAIADSVGGGANYFPGNIAGTTASGGQYV